MATTAEIRLKLRELDGLAAQGNKEAEADARALAGILTNRMSAEQRPGPPKPMGVVEDVARSAGSGLKAGSEELIGGPQDTGNIASRGASWLARRMGASPETEKAAGATAGHIASSALNPMSGVAKMLKYAGGPDLTSYYSPDTAQVKSAVETAVPATKDINHVPQTTAGQYAHTGMEFVPQAIFGKPNPKAFLTRTAEQLGSGLASEGAGQATSGTKYEPWARFAGGAGTSALLSSSILRRGPVTEAAASQMAKGNPLTAGQALNSPTLMKFEGALAPGQVQSLVERQGANYTAQQMERLGAPAGSLMTPENMTREHGRIQADLDRVEQAVGRVPYSPRHQQDLLDAVEVYNGNVGPNNRAPVVQETLSDIGSLMRQNGGPVLTGPQLANIRTKMRNAMEGADGQTVTTLRKIQAALDNGTDTHVANNQPELAGQWQKSRSQYRMYLDLEDALANAPMASFEKGHITPAALRGGVKNVEGNRRLVQGKSEYTDAAKEGAAAMPKLPDSGTPAGLRAMGTGVALGTGNIPGAIGAVLGPIGAGKALMSPAVQKLLMSTGDDPRALLTALISGRQGTKSMGGPRR